MRRCDTAATRGDGGSRGAGLSRRSHSTGALPGRHVRDHVAMRSTSHPSGHPAVPPVYWRNAGSLVSRRRRAAACGRLGESRRRLEARDGAGQLECGRRPCVVQRRTAKSTMLPLRRTEQLATTLSDHHDARWACTRCFLRGTMREVQASTTSFGARVARHGCPEFAARCRAGWCLTTVPPALHAVTTPMGYCSVRQRMMAAPATTQAGMLLERRRPGRGVDFAEAEAAAHLRMRGWQRGGRNLFGEGFERGVLRGSMSQARQADRTAARSSRRSRGSPPYRVFSRCGRGFKQPLAIAGRERDQSAVAGQRHRQFFWASAGRTLYQRLGGRRGVDAVGLDQAGLQRDPFEEEGTNAELLPGGGSAKAARNPGLYLGRSSAASSPCRAAAPSARGWLKLR